jgi:hypothetical protein
MDEYSNLDDVIDRVERLIDGYGFLLSVGERLLGRECIKIVANDIQARAAHGEGSEGEWAPNSDVPEGKGYKIYKERVYDVVDAPNVRTGDMLSARALSNGTVSNEAVEMAYGTGDVPREGRGRTVKEADKKLTDRQKAYYAHTGQGPHGTTRRFYALSEDAVAGIRDACQERLNQYVRDGLDGQGA